MTVIILHSMPDRTEHFDAACVVYARAGKVALALHRDRRASALTLLTARLLGRGYSVLTHVPLDALERWASPSTPHAALSAARRILKQRGKYDE